MCSLTRGLLQTTSSGCPLDVENLVDGQAWKGRCGGGVTDAQQQHRHLTTREELVQPAP